MNMLEIKFIRQNLTEVKQAMANRGDRLDLDALIGADDNRKKMLLEIEALLIVKVDFRGVGAAAEYESDKKQGRAHMTIKVPQVS